MNDNPISITKEREYNVYKKNSLIQESRFSLTLNQQKTLLYLISKITDAKSIQSVFTISVEEYCKVAGISAIDGYYSLVRQDLQAISNASVWIAQDSGKKSLLHWLDIVRVDEYKGIIEITFSKSIQPYLFFFTDNGNYTKYPLLYVLPMRNRHSIRLYELLKSYASMEGLRISIDQLKLRIDAADGEEETKYDRFVDFRRYILDRAIEEINQYTDIKVGYTQIRGGRKTTEIQFSIERKSYIDKYEAKRNVARKIEGPRRKKPESHNEDQERMQQEVRKILQGTEFQQIDSKVLKKAIKTIVDEQIKRAKDGLNQEPEKEVPEQK